MSFLGDIVNSIGSGKAPTPPKPLVRPIAINPQRLTQDAGRPAARAGFQVTPSPLNGTKRKADDDSLKVPEKHTRPNPTPGLTGTINRRTAAPPLNAPRPSPEKPATALKPRLETTIATSKPGTTPPVTPTTSNVKPPAKGSYADIMARAKQAQEAKSQNQVGMIKHQATNREKVSKLAERKSKKKRKQRRPRRSTLVGWRRLAEQRKDGVSALSRSPISHELPKLLDHLYMRHRQHTEGQWALLQQSLDYRHHVSKAATMNIWARTKRKIRKSTMTRRLWFRCLF